MSTVSSDRELAAAVAELRRAQEERSRITSSRLLRTGLLLRQFLKIVLREGASFLADLKMWLPVQAGTAMLWKNRQTTTELDLSEGHRCEIRMRLSSEISQAKAVLLSIEYLDKARETIGWEESGFTFSGRWGFFSYLPASPEGETFRLAVDPPDGAAVMRVYLVGWSADGNVLVSDLSVRAIGETIDVQRKTLFSVIEALDGRSPVTVWYQGRLGDSQAPPVEGTGLFFCDGTDGDGSADVHRFSVDLFDDSYQQIAATVGSGVSRTLTVDQTGYYSVLSANYFVANGWSFEFRGSGDSTKARYLSTLSDSGPDTGIAVAV